MKKKELMTLVPPEMTPDLMEIASQDTPVQSQHWASDKEYKYGRYFLAKKEKVYKMYPGNSSAFRLPCYGIRPF